MFLHSSIMMKIGAKKCIPTFKLWTLIRIKGRISLENVYTNLQIKSQWITRGARLYFFHLNKSVSRPNYSTTVKKSRVKTSCSWNPFIRIVDFSSLKVQYIGHAVWNWVWQRAFKLTTLNGTYKNPNKSNSTKSPKKKGKREKKKLKNENPISGKIFYHILYIDKG